MIGQCSTPTETRHIDAEGSNFNKLGNGLVDVTYFRNRKPGPEMRIEDAVIKHIPNLSLYTELPSWTGGSVPIGAGMPDLVIASYHPEVYALAKSDLPDAQILSYLKAVNSAKLETIAESTGKPKKAVAKSLANLLESNAVESASETFTLSEKWRSILPEIITIEAKVSNWKKALEQARRNCIFAHGSYVAFPSNVANRVASDRDILRSGVGVLSVSESNETVVIRRSRYFRPKVWYYYYQLALIIANPARKNKDNAVCSSDGGRPSRLSSIQLHQTADA